MFGEKPVPVLLCVPQITLIGNESGSPQ